jgi:plasmid stabilization system protein ParE
MARAVIWSPAARADLREIEAYIAVRSPLGARRVIESLRAAAHKYRDFPFSARMVPDFQDPNRQETFVFEYRLMFRVEPTRIEVLRVVHGRRLMSNVPGSFEEAPQAAYNAT